jgi:3-oxoacyl-[acyl-carrier-protein] synthase II
LKTESPKRVAITGLGVITSIGESLSEFNRSLFEGRCGIGPVSLFDVSGFSCHTAAQVNKPDLASFLSSREARRMSRCDVLGLFACREAVADAGLGPDVCDPARASVIMGGGAGGMLSWEGYRRAMHCGVKRPRPSSLLSVSQCAITDLIANRYGLTGARLTVSTACSSSATAIGYGFDLIRSGGQTLVITGGSESLSELTFAGFNALRQVAPDYCRPFDRYRQGLSLGEGAAILVLEDWDHARKRGARIRAEVLGYAINSDAYHMTAPHPQAKGMTQVMNMALGRAAVRPDQVDYINTHGTGTKKNDHAETLAVKAVFGETHSRRLSLSSVKSMVGHCLGASGAIEAVATVLALLTQTVPPTIHLDTPDEACDLDYTPNLARPRKIDVALSNSFAFGGNNTCLVFRKADEGS